ncbi:hypothetical protein [Acinetobacter indicus]|uniref:hypothetical protein n=1 Tax=Acinetobacter indicus TaxID=756892 RepID=UPI000CEC3239|nr:hypothetical protein [Acinetobacter indicus]
MNKKTIILCILSTCFISVTSFSKSSPSLDEILLCYGWSERAQEKPFFLEGFTNEIFESKSDKNMLKLFNNNYKEKTYKSPKKEYYNEYEESDDLGPITYYPRDKSKSIFEKIEFHGFYGAGFEYSAKFQPNVNIQEIKEKLEKRDNFKFKNYPKNQLKDFSKDYNKLINTENRMKYLNQKYPWLTSIHPTDLQSLSIFGKKIINNPHFFSYISIQHKGEKKPEYYMVCGVSEYYE